MEDVLTVIDGWANIADQIAKRSKELIRFLSEEFSKLIKNENFKDSVPGHISGNRVSIVLKRIGEIVVLQP